MEVPTVKLCFAGGGKMAEALIGGLISTGWASADELGVIEIVEARRDELATMFPGLHLAADSAAACSSAAFDVTNVLVAVKPQHVGDVAGELGVGGTERALSIAAGVRIDVLQAGFGASTRVVRAMPNTPALVGEGAAAIAPSKNATADDLVWAQSILSAVGTVAIVDETDLDAVTGVSGSGPAYLFLLAEAMTAAGVEQGLSPQTADALTRQTLLGASTLLASSGDDAAQLRANVTSPGGTTQAAIASLQSAMFEQIVGAAIADATARSRELGEG